MKKFLVICALCLSNIYLTWGEATNNVTNFMIFLKNGEDYMVTPTDYSENDVLQHFSATLTWNGQTVMIAAGDTDSQARFMIQKKPDGSGESLIILRVTLQRFSGTIPLEEDDPEGSKIHVSIMTSDGFIKEEDVPRTTASGVQRVEIDMAH